MSVSGGEAEQPFWRRGRTLAVLVLALGFGLLVVAALAGRYFIFTKGLLLPLLALVAILSHRARQFLRDWWLFLVLLLLFDSVRGAIYAAIFRWDLPWYMGYVIRLEERVFGVESAPHWLHRTWPALLENDTLSALMVIVHASHFVYFIGIGCLVYYLRPAEFGRYKAVMVIVMFTGLFFYLVVPTVPPWMAGTFFDVLPPIERPAFQSYNAIVPSLFAGFQINYIAAMPSLHAAFPTACCAIVWRLFGWRALPLVGYTALTLFSPIYLAEHYAVDILAGILLGLAAYALVFHSGRFAAGENPGHDEAAAAANGRWRSLVAFVGPRRFYGGLLLLYLTVALGFTNRGVYFPELVPDKSFIERELVGRSSLVPFFAGARALQQGRIETARRLLTDGLNRPAVGAEQFTGCLLLLRVATDAKALPTLIELLRAAPTARRTPYGDHVLKEALKRVGS